jgi:mono/diheme cytochrome c family protein
VNPDLSKRNWKRKLITVAIVLVVLAVPVGLFAWYKFFREVPQPAWITGDPEMEFLYGSIGSESSAGIPYWIVVVLPRIFGEEYLPGPGGYASVGLPWEEGREFPVGFSKKTIGFERVGFNCALCHATQYRLTADARPTIVAAGGSHTADIQALLEFFSKAAADPRFNSSTILTEIDLAYRLSFIDRLLYKFLFIPLTRKQLIEQGEGFAWADSRPRWGPGRDPPMNLTKFNFLGLDDDGSVDNTDFPSIWHLGVRVQEGRVWPEDDYAPEADWSRYPIPADRFMLMNLAGDTTSIRSVLIDSALGLQAENSSFFRDRMARLEEWLKALPPPVYPLPIDAALADRGAALFEQSCAQCHASGRDNRMGTVIPLGEVGTDPARTNAWTLEAANAANEKVLEFDIERTPMSKPETPGYTALQLDGLWLRAPYLHNGSVPTVRALLEPPECRPQTFYRGYDVIDAEHLGFVSQQSCPAIVRPAAPGCPAVEIEAGCMPGDEGWLLDTSLPGNGNGGHRYGTDLSADEKTALVEYLKRF